MILPVNAIKVSNLSWTSNSAVQKDAATNSDIANNDKKTFIYRAQSGVSLRLSCRCWCRRLSGN